MLIITNRVRSTRREVIVSLCLSVHTCSGEGGYPSQVQPVGYSSQGAPTYGTPRPSQDGGIPQPGRCLPRYPPAKSGWGVSQPGVPPCQFRMPRSICLLRSRRRTFLLFTWVLKFNQTVLKLSIDLLVKLQDWDSLWLRRSKNIRKNTILKSQQYMNCSCLSEVKDWKT